MGDIHDPAIGYVNVGRSYETSALRLLLEDATKTSYLPAFPRRQLFVMAIELYLKAYLLLQDMSESEIRRTFSHKVGAIGSCCRSLGLKISEEQFEVLTLIEDTETFTRDRYFMGGIRRGLRDDALQDLAGVLFKAVGQSVADKRGKKFNLRGVSPVNKNRGD
ncbi:hypothetical protein [Parasedimentitalea huanghaiensis]|uniref:HEPN domain-containing protein n=1 Tax=Parasedimentitalea huanghaiensis TaxID=2682100 RepID=A0A6L6WE04_9RHOB|nr:hypothetical protein [Zongyanglinia huanghaiensis]MVO14795.1 hypothetical protein [Zongyanglinia huanghaiensis]